MRVSMVAMGPEDAFEFETLVSCSLCRIFESLAGVDKTTPVEIYIGKKSGTANGLMIRVRTFHQNGMLAGEVKPSSTPGSHIPKIQGFGESEIIQILVMRAQQHLTVFWGNPVRRGQEGSGYYLCNELRGNQLQ